MVKSLRVILFVLVIYGGQCIPVLAVEKRDSRDSGCDSILSAKIEKLNDQINQNFKSLEEIRKQNNQIVSMLTSKNENLNRVMPNTSFASVKTKVLRSCSDVPTKKSGPYLLQPFAGENPFNMYCEQQAFGGGWLVFHSRFNGSVSFDRNWAEYRAGFGAVTGEFWLGFEKLHRITKAKKHILVVEVKKFDGSYGYAIYDGFEIGSETEKFSLKHLGSYSGTAGDSLDRQRGMGFTTKDWDNDLWQEGNCAVFYRGAWWHNWNSKSSLNGPYGWAKHHETNFWVGFTNDKGEGLKMTRMMIKEI